ncbi:Zinc finger protein [Paragonimus heterotremus]|uniref:Zinc finger protein n=1 Tax=Paragonimus heterotremus TaxID=100268 RepID=A0A8J4TAK3_9TREM|nr:Zinc finger protein [Paragonimus heterotremus]
MAERLKCRWVGCEATFVDLTTFGHHLFEQHQISSASGCLWESCTKQLESDDLAMNVSKMHLLSHAVFESYCWNAKSSLIARGFDSLPSSFSCVHNSLLHAYDDLCLFDSDDPSPKLTAFGETLQLESSVGLYGCSHCNSAFRTELEFLRHIFPALCNFYHTSQIDSSSLQCQWIGCDNIFQTYIGLHAHVEKFHRCKGITPFCFWRSCANRVEELISDNHWLRHLLMHTFLEARVNFTRQQLCLHGKSWNFVCGGIDYQKLSFVLHSSERLLWSRSILDRGFLCHWSGCDYRTDSAQLFVEHVSEHALLDVHLKGPFLCKWNSSAILKENTSLETQQLCDRTLSTLSNLREHLYRHTGLPKFVCDRCRVGFSELNTFKEHFAWSLPEQSLDISPSVASPNMDTLQPNDDVLSKKYESSKSDRFPSPVYACESCSKSFLTQHRLIAHRKTPRCIARRHQELSKSISVSEPQASRQPLTHRVCKRVSKDDLFAEDAQQSMPSHIYCCKVDGCYFTTPKYTAYQFHFRRYHSTVNADGLWYECHLCPDYRARKVQTLSLHLRRMHGIWPPEGKQRFSYTCDPHDGVYRMTGLPIPSNPPLPRKIAPR